MPALASKACGSFFRHKELFLSYDAVTRTGPSRGHWTELASREFVVWGTEEATIQSVLSGGHSGALTPTAFLKTACFGA